MASLTASFCAELSCQVPNPIAGMYAPVLSLNLAIFACLTGWLLAG